MSRIINFYRDKLKANGKDGYYFSDILNWDDYLIETRHDFIQWLFPDRTGGIIKGEKLTKQDIEYFKNDIQIRKMVFKAVQRMVEFYGYKIYDTQVVQIKPIKRFLKNTYIGLYSEHNYNRLTRMMLFLNEINMKYISSLIMLMICDSLRKDKNLQQKVKDSNAIYYWFNCHDYLHPYLKDYNFNLLETEKCNFIGLSFTGNSCYQDSVLLPLFAEENSFIKIHILKKDLSQISKMKNKFIVCGKDYEKDLKVRTAIQEELKSISKFMREKEGEKTCSQLRKLFRFCPTYSNQKFYSTQTQDAGEFLLYLFSIFEVEGAQVNIKKFVFNKESIEIISEIKTKETPIILIENEELKSENLNTKDYISKLSQLPVPYIDKKGYKHEFKYEEKKVIDTDFLIFYAQRLYIDNQGNKNRLYTKIYPSQTIKIGKKSLELYSVVVHEHNHYTCYIKCGEKWFYYDDLHSEINFIGDFETMLKEQRKPNPMTNGTLYFYRLKMDPYYGEIKCVICQEKGNKKINNAYYNCDGKFTCGVHSKNKDRVKLLKNENKKKDLIEKYKYYMDKAKETADKNKKQGKKGKLTLQKIHMMRAPQLKEGVILVFPNYKHGNRKDGIGMKSLSPKDIGPIEEYKDLPSAYNLENWWQGNKVYEGEIKNGKPLPVFFKNRKQMYESKIPYRHKTDLFKTIGKKVYGWYLEERLLSYLESRKFYCSMYEKLTKNNPDLLKIKQMIDDGYNIEIVGYDAIPLKTDNYFEEISKLYVDSSHPFGHEMVIASLILLEEHQYPWKK